ncbi:hypothetical protein HYV49_04795 [Candidatus Pacearchaeota archaeon]|nr:hypothetical protein [Candidatus Pacearchaeota archaeon]
MRLLDKLKEYLGLKNKSQQEESASKEPEFKLEIPKFSLEFDVYCQSCGRDITMFGGCVSINGNIYCYGQRCTDKEKINMLQGKLPHSQIFFRLYEFSEVQEAIRRKELTNYGPLEI